MREGGGGAGGKRGGRGIERRWVYTRMGREREGGMERGEGRERERDQRKRKERRGCIGGEMVGW